MNENWVMLVVGVWLIVVGIGATNVSGAMPGAKPGPPPTLLFRLILIFFGILMSVLGTVRLLHK